MRAVGEAVCPTSPTPPSKRLSASKLAKMTSENACGCRFPKKLRHKDWHRYLGYDGAPYFEKEYGDYLLTGIPDKFNGSVVELKTFYYPECERKMIERGLKQLEVYGYISGNPNLELHTYDTRRGQFSELIRFKADESRLEGIVKAYESTLTDINK